MTSHVYTSGIADFIQLLVSHKHACGFPYDTSERILGHFDSMVADRFPDAATVTKPMCDAWVGCRPGEHPNGLARRVTPIRQLAKFLNGTGVPAHIPAPVPGRRIKYEPHIYTSTELTAFFHSIDACPPSVYSPTRQYVIPVLFRLLYCCGLRSSEARLLRVEDVDLDTGVVTIRESKGWSARIVALSNDLRGLCQRYDTVMGSVIPHREVFFPNKDGQPFTGSTIDTWFHEFWDHLPEAGLVVGNPARVHDLRHTFAVDRLNQWVEQGHDLDSLYPYLSQYMGHSHYADTDYYLTLTASFYPQMDHLLSPVNADILPEVCHDNQ